MVNEIKVLNEADELLGRYPPLHLTFDCSPFLEVLQLLLEISTDTPWSKTSQQNIHAMVVPVIVAIPQMPYWHWCMPVLMNNSLRQSKPLTRQTVLLTVPINQKLPNETITILLVGESI